MSRRALTLLFLALFASAATVTTSTLAASFDPAAFKALQWREVGPYRGGRSAAVEGVPSQPNTYYFGSVGGGVWKTTDGGENWMPVSDGFFGGSIGAVAVAESDPNVVYVGGGEKTVRGNVSHGEGMWKSLDAGKTWTNVGLKDSRRIPRVRIHPRNPDLVYAAVLGHLFGPSQERGVYRSKDGGKTWERILFANENAGAVDLILDPGNPRVIYASTWRVRRTPYSLESGGEGSALWKSTDGGDTWRNLSAVKGMPKGPLGIIGITVSRSNSQNLYANIEAAEGGVFRSRDGGETWERTSELRDLRQRAWYYTRIYADPKDEDTVYVTNVRFLKSKDGGKTFADIRTPHGDNHDLWIAPDNPLRMIESNDGGANVTTDGGRSWTDQRNQPTAQFYRVTTDNSFPYRILGAQQDNSAVRIRHRSTGPGISEDDWEETAGGESGHIVARPDDPDVVYGGSYGGFLTMVNHRTEQVRDVNPWPDNPMGYGAEGAAERFQWNFPLLFSPHDANTMYAASQHLWKSTNGGASWERISDDLTRNDKSKMGPSGGPITKDNTSVEYYGTIFAVAESALEPGVIWAGSDDGLIHLTRDGGKSWTNVTPKTIPEWIMINSIDPSPFDKGTAYVAATMYKSDDFRPYLFKTTDYGATWTKITNGIASDHFTRVVRSDKRRKGLLYAGTERGMYVSFDDGANWQSLQLNLPIVPITDLTLHDDDLIAATQGRSFWVLDDITPLQQLSAAQPNRSYLFEPRPAWRMPGFTFERMPRNQGKNPPQGVIVNYWLPTDVKSGTKVKLAFLNADGSVIRELEGEVKPPAEPEKAHEQKDAMKEPPPAEPEKKIGIKSEGGASEKQEAEAEKDPKAEKEKERNKLPDSRPGFNRFAWNLRYPEAKKFEGLILWGGGTDGPRVLPGTYGVRLTVGDDAPIATVATVKQDPRSTASPAELQAQFDLLLGANRKLSEIHEQIERIREVRKQLTDLRTRVGKDEKAKPIADAAKELDKKMTAIEEALYQTKNKSPQDPLNFPIRLNDKLAALADSAGTGDFPPTAQHRLVYAQLVEKIDAQLAQLKALWEKDLPALNALVKASDVVAVK